jgi:hypothetical protein
LSTRYGFEKSDATDIVIRASLPKFAADYLRTACK